MKPQEPKRGETWVPKRRTRNGATEFRVTGVADGQVRGNLLFASGRWQMSTRIRIDLFVRRYELPQ